MSSFEWHGEEKDSSVVFSSVNAVAVYRNESGDLVLKQQGERGEDDDIIVIPEMFLPMVLSAINQAMQDK